MKLKLPDLEVSRDASPRWKDAGTTRSVQVGPVRFGGGQTVIIAGPCAVAGREQTLQIARDVLACGGHMLRGGAYKPRTNPHSFQGLGVEGLQILAEARAETGLPVVTEVLDPHLVETVTQYADMLQIGSRNMQNFPLLREVGASGRPVLLKRGFGSTVEEWICAAEYLAMAGNLDIVLCERGIRTFANGVYDRATLDLAAIDVVRGSTPFPVIVDPSHAAGRADLVVPLALAGLCQRAHGLIVEIVSAGTDRSTVPCDAEQAIEPDDLRRIVTAAEALPALLEAPRPTRR